MVLQHVITFPTSFKPRLKTYASIICGKYIGTNISKGLHKLHRLFSPRYYSSCLIASPLLWQSLLELQVRMHIPSMPHDERTTSYACKHISFGASNPFLLATLSTNFSRFPPYYLYYDQMIHCGVFWFKACLPNPLFMLASTHELIFCSMIVRYNLATIELIVLL